MEDNHIGTWRPPQVRSSVLDWLSTTRGHHSDRHKSNKLVSNSHERAEGQEKPNIRALRTQSEDQGSELQKEGAHLERKGAIWKGQPREGVEPQIELSLGPLLSCVDLSGKGDGA
jgi:hypothetical protein